MSSTDSLPDVEGGFDVIIDHQLAPLSTPAAREILFDDYSTGYEIEALLDPLSEAVFAICCQGGELDTAGIADRIDVAAKHRRCVEASISRADAAGQAWAAIFADHAHRFPAAEKAAAGKFEWARWTALHPDDLTAAGMGFDVEKAAKKLAQASHDVLGQDLSAGDAAVATIEGLKAAGFTVHREHWSDAWRGAQSGVREREEDREYADQKRRDLEHKLEAEFARVLGDAL